MNAAQVAELDALADVLAGLPMEPDAARDRAALGAEVQRLEKLHHEARLSLSRAMFPGLS